MNASRLALLAVVALGAVLPAVPAAAQEKKFVVKPIAEKRLKQLPPGPWYWRIENFPSLADARAAIGQGQWNPNTVSYDGAPALAAEVQGKAWLFTLGPKGGATPGGTKVADIGPVPEITATEYLLRINHTGGVPGVKTPVHSHPGSETFYVLSGQLSQRSPQGERHVDAGQSMLGMGADMALEVSSSGSEELHALVLFVVDGSKPFSTPAKLP